MSRITRLVAVWSAAIVIGLIVGGAVFGDGTAGLALAALIAWLVKAVLQAVLHRLEVRFVPGRMANFRSPASEDSDQDDSDTPDEPPKRRRIRRRR